MQKFVVLLGVASVSAFDCGLVEDTAPEPNCGGFPDVFNVWALPMCPNTAATSTTYVSQFDSCISTTQFRSCVWDGWNKIQTNTYWSLQNFLWADSRDICAGVQCEAYALWADCLRTAKNDGVCALDFSLCMAEMCKPQLTFGDRLAGTSCTADSECASGQCFLGTCQTPSGWYGSTCYNSRLQPSDSAQWAGCVAADASSTYAAALPSATWRDLRDNLDAQKALCDNNDGWMDTEVYRVSRSCPTSDQPEVLAYSEPFCRRTLPTSSGTAMVEAEVAEEYFEVICDQAGKLISVSNDNDITVDIPTQDACYAARDQMNSLGIAVGQKCYAQCDPDSAATIAVSILLGLL